MSQIFTTLTEALNQIQEKITGIQLEGGVTKENHGLILERLTRTIFDLKTTIGALQNQYMTLDGAVDLVNVTLTNLQSIDNSLAAQLASAVSGLSALESAVDTLEPLLDRVGSLGQLTTTARNSLVAAVNEVKASLDLLASSSTFATTSNLNALSTRVDNFAAGRFQDYFFQFSAGDVSPADWNSWVNRVQRHAPYPLDSAASDTLAQSTIRWIGSRSGLKYGAFQAGGGTRQHPLIGDDGRIVAIYDGGQRHLAVNTRFDVATGTKNSPLNSASQTTAATDPPQNKPNVPVRRWLSVGSAYVFEFDLEARVRRPLVLAAANSTHVSVADNAAYSFTDKVSFVAEVYLNPSASGEFPILCKGTAANNAEYYLCVTVDRRLRLRLYQNQDQAVYREAVSTETLGTGKFQRVCVTFDGSVVSMYVNNVPVTVTSSLVGTGAFTGMTNGTSPLLLGAAFTQTGQAVYATGHLRNVRLYRHALSAQDLGQLVANTLPIVPVAFWRLDEGNGATVADSVTTGSSPVQGAVVWRSNFAVDTVRIDPALNGSTVPNLPCFALQLYDSMQWRVVTRGAADLSLPLTHSAEDLYPYNPDTSVRFEIEVFFHPTNGYWRVRADNILIATHTDVPTYYENTHPGLLAGVLSFGVTGSATEPSICEAWYDNIRVRHKQG